MAASTINWQRVLPCNSTCLTSQTDADVPTSGFWPGLKPFGNISQQVTKLLLEVLLVYPNNFVTFVAKNLGWLTPSVLLTH
jgi:hypothetical protein